MGLLGLGSCPQLQPMSLGPGWGCQLLEWLPWATDPAVPALNPMSKPALLRPWGGHSEKSNLHPGASAPLSSPCSSPGCSKVVPWVSCTGSGQMLEHRRLLAPATLPFGATFGEPQRFASAGKPVGPIGRGCTVGRHLGCPAPLSKVSAACVCNRGRGGGFCEHGGARDGTLLL